MSLLFVALRVTAGDVVEFSIVGRIKFSVPADWVVITSKSDPKITLFAFQIKNPADEGTADSTNFVITSYYLKDSAANAKFKKAISDENPKAQKRELGEGWNCSTFSALQNSTRYEVWDCNRKITNCGVAVRLAWPELPKNPADYGKRMEAALTDVLESVAPSAK